MARLAVLNVLASQAAMSLEKTRLYRELQQREAGILEARATLAQRQRISMMGEAAASLAQEIKQPIAAAKIDAKVCVSALAEGRLDLQAAREAASRMAEEAAWAAEVITRTTALFRKDTVRERVPISAVVREMAVLLRHEAAAASIAIRIEIAESITDVMTDRVQLQQVFMNLMLNAIDAMKAGGGDPRSVRALFTNGGLGFFVFPKTPQRTGTAATRAGCCHPPDE
jgi:C4-dicarboxylate-specific signal transduction histidine kinase